MYSVPQRHSLYCVEGFTDLTQSIQYGEIQKIATLTLKLVLAQILPFAYGNKRTLALKLIAYFGGAFATPFAISWYQW